MDWLGRQAAKTEFEAFVKESSDDLVRSAYMLTFDFARAEDLVQEAYLRVARRWDRVRSTSCSIIARRRLLDTRAVSAYQRTKVG